MPNNLGGTMKTLSLCVFFILTMNLAFSADLPVCKNVNGNQLSGSINEVRQIMNTNANRPQIFVTGVITQVLPEDNQGLPHQKFMLNVSGISLEIVSNLDFGRIPLAVGETVSVCGEFLHVGAGMVHWTHFDPHGGHANGFTIVNGQAYGETETPY